MRKKSDSSGTTLGKLPPQDRETEAAILGALILEAKRAMYIASTLLKPEAFYVESHQLVCQVILSLYKAEKKIDLITVKNEANRLGILEEIGGAYFLTELTSRVASSDNIDHHIMIINYLYQLRELIRFGVEMVNDGYDVGNSPLELISKGVKFMNDLKNLNVQRSEKSINELIEMMQAEMNKPKVNGLLGLSSGSVALDSITKGWQPGQLIVPAARPAMGKTADMCSQIAHIGFILQKPVGVFSLEMNSVQLTFRIASNLSSIPQLKLKMNDLTETEKHRISDYCERISKAPIYMDDTAAIDIDELEAKATLMKAMYDIQIIFIDYMQLITWKGSSKFNNRESDVAEISKRLKKIAKNLGIPVVALCQLSRAVESRPGSNYMPQLSDLRESGSIEQDADVVYFPWRPEYYKLTQDIFFPKFGLTLPVNKLLVHVVSKCRDEETGLVPLKADLSIMKIGDHPSYIDKIKQPEMALRFNPPSSDDNDDAPF